MPASLLQSARGGPEPSGRKGKREIVHKEADPVRVQLHLLVSPGTVFSPSRRALPDAEVALHRGSWQPHHMLPQVMGLLMPPALAWFPRLPPHPRPTPRSVPDVSQPGEQVTGQCDAPHQSHCLLILAGHFWVLYRTPWPGSVNKITRQSRIRNSAQDRAFMPRNCVLAAVGSI